MTNIKSTHLTIREDRPTAIGSSAQRSNLDAIAFNITFLSIRNPKLAIEALKLYARAVKVSENDPSVLEEDIALFATEFAKMAESKKQ
jgi:hypothetical protein